MLGWFPGARPHNLSNKSCNNPFTLQCCDAHDIVFGHPSFRWGIFILKGTSQSWPFKFACGINQIIVQRNEGHSSCFGVGGRTCHMTAVTEILQYRASRVYLCLSESVYLKNHRHLFTLRFGNGVRIGEAKNPGPTESNMENFRLALVNPTTLLHRKEDLLQLNADAIALAETSATAKVQIQTIQDFRSSKHSCVFSAPVDNQKQRLDGDTSLRGQAAGTAVIARVPIRAYRHEVEISPRFHTRLQFAFLQFGSTTILLCVMYGFQQNLHQSRQNTDELLLEAANLLISHPGPTILLGDINHDLETLESWKNFQDAGFQSSKDLYRHLYDTPMPPTYLESTTRDLGILVLNSLHTSNRSRLIALPSFRDIIRSFLIFCCQQAASQKLFGGSLSTGRN